MIDDGDSLDTVTTLSGLDYWSNNVTTSTTLGSTGSTGTLRTTLGTVGSTGASNVTWTTPGTITTGGYINTTVTAPSLTSGNWLGNVTVGSHQAGLRVAGDAHFDGEIIVQGVKLADRLDKIEERLGILRPNEKLEEKWDELKALGDRYRELEKDILEKEKIWDLLKK